MTHRVYYYPADAGNFCHEPLDFTKAFPRTPNANGKDNNATSKALAWKPPFILMVDRHSHAQNCDFVRMVRVLCIFTLWLMMSWPANHS